MRVTEETPDRLSASIRATFTGVFCAVFGAFFVLIGGAALAGGQAQGAIILVAGGGVAALGAFLLLRPTRLVLDRRANTATITRSGLRGQSRQAIPLDQVAKLHVHRKGTGSGRLYHLVLWVPEGAHQGEHPLTRGYSTGGWRKGRLARRVNAWLGVKSQKPASVARL
ncbi:MAG: hypothetical protein EP318_14910 [Rhodobacteraceae bacterium]|nr:MAG: hypothetical protein EP318_14910 [Paracoccaceae bacterium]